MKTNMMRSYSFTFPDMDGDGLDTVLRVSETPKRDAVELSLSYNDATARARLNSWEWYDISATERRPREAYRDGLLNALTTASGNLTLVALQDGYDLRMGTLTVHLTRDQLRDIGACDVSVIAADAPATTEAA